MSCQHKGVFSHVALSLLAVSISKLQSVCDRSYFFASTYTNIDHRQEWTEQQIAPTENIYES